MFTDPQTTHKHLQYPIYPPTKLFGSLLTSHVDLCHIGKAFRKTIVNLYRDII